MTRILKMAAALAAVLTIGLATAPAGAATKYAHPKMEKWYAHQGGKKALNNLAKDLNGISQDATNEDISALGTACQDLRNDSQVNLSIRPIPSASVERLWVAGLNDYMQAGITCVNGVNDNSGSEIEQATSDIAAGNALINHLDSEL